MENIVDKEIIMMQEYRIAKENILQALSIKQIKNPDAKEEIDFLRRRL